MPLANRIALVTGGKRIGQVVAEELARAGRRCRAVLPVVAAGGRGDGHARPRAGTAGDRAPGRRQPARRLRSPGAGHRATTRRPRHRRQHGVDVRVAAARRHRRARVARRHRREPVVGVPRHPRRAAAAPAPLAGTRGQLHRLAAGERQATLPGVRGVLRRQGRREGAHRGTGARTREGRHPGERHRAGPDRPAARPRSGGSRARSPRPRRCSDGAANSRSPAPSCCW